MEQIHLYQDDSSSSSTLMDANSAIAQNSAQALENCIQSLMHAQQCTVAGCQRPLCPRMKSKMAHFRSCQRKTDGSCPLCKRMIGLFTYHAKQCREMQCSVPYCVAFRQKMTMQQSVSVLFWCHCYFLCFILFAIVLLLSFNYFQLLYFALCIAV